MTTTCHDSATMGRPKKDKPKDARLDFRTYSEVRDALERYASTEYRSLAQQCEMILRQWVIARMQADGEDTTAIEELP